MDSDLETTSGAPTRALFSVGSRHVAFLGLNGVAHGLEFVNRTIPAQGDARIGIHRTINRYSVPDMIPRTAAAGSLAPVIGRPTTMCDAPAAKASAGVTTRI